MRRIRALAAVVAASLALAAAAGAGTASGATVWLCKPGAADNPCRVSLDTTRITPTGEVTGTSSPQRNRRPKIDCFYVYPTVSDDPTRNSDLSIDPEERSIALYQAARYSQYCRVFAPVYRQITLASLLSGQPVTPEEAALAYGDVVAAWRTYLRKYNDGRGVVLISHSQGTRVLRALVAERIDPRPGVRRRLVTAILLGGNVLVAKGQGSGGDFSHIPACERKRQTGCVIAFSTYNNAVPADSRFGRPGGGYFGGDPATQDVLCTNPAALGGGAAPLRSILPSEPFAPETTIGIATRALGFPRLTIPTTWIEANGAYTGICSSADNANVLQLTDAPGAPHLNAIPDQSWGLHLADGNIALGNLLDVVRAQRNAYLDNRP
jgi:Protein of unknown function (DUF3089)